MNDRRKRRRRLGPGLTGALAAIAVVAACEGADHGSAEGGWELSIDTLRSQSGGNGSSTWLRAVGKEGPPGAPQTEAVVLRFDCLPGHAITTIMTDQALRQGTVKVELKVDSEKPRRLPGFAGTTATGGQVVLETPQDSVLTLLSGHQRATIDYSDGAGSSKSTAVFTVANLEKYREPFRAACAR